MALKTPVSDDTVKRALPLWQEGRAVQGVERGSISIPLTPPLSKIAPLSHSRRSLHHHWFRWAFSPEIPFLPSLVVSFIQSTSPSTSYVPWTVLWPVDTNMNKIGYVLPWNKHWTWRDMSAHSEVLVGAEWFEKLVLPGVAEGVFKEKCPWRMSQIESDREHKGRVDRDHR